MNSSDSSEPDLSSQNRINDELPRGDLAAVDEIMEAYLRRHPPEEVRVVDLNALLTSLLPMLDRLLPDCVEMAMGLAPGLARVQADESQLEQVVLNLAINAFDAMPAGGELAIETAAVDVGLGGDDPPDLAPGAYAVIRVSDTGVGMDREVISRIFEPFFTTKGQGKGTGLGLSVVHGIVRRHGGSVVASSAPGKGSTFQVYVPACDHR